MILGITLALTIPVFATASAAEDPFSEACNQPGASSSQVCQNTARGGGDPITGEQGIITSITNIVALLAGVAAVVIIIIAGLQYILANGDSTKLTNARNAIIYAAIGLIFIVVARGVIIFVLNRL